jgi:salicylate hydroxylase
MPEDLRWNAATLWAGPKCHIVHYPLQGWKTFNLVVTYHNQAAEPAAGVPVTREEVLKGFAHVCETAQKIIHHGKDWRLWVLCDREPITNWVEGRVALLGDAAHPMLQYMAQGACMAMEDGIVLASRLASLPVEAALQSYNEARVLRTTRMQLMSREVGNHIYHPAGAHAQLRNSIMQAKSAQDWFETMDWVYSYKPQEA